MNVRTTPAQAPAAATVGQTIDAMMWDKIKARSERSARKSYQGWAIYWTIIPKKKFEATHDIDFIDSLDGDKTNNYSVLEVVVYVPEFCNFLPQPDPKVLEKLKTKPKGAKGSIPPAEKAAREKVKKKIERFPKGYKIVTGASGMPFMKKVTIDFDRDYDYSSGKLII
jgi:hypothetical protein